VLGPHTVKGSSVLRKPKHKPTIGHELAGFDSPAEGIYAPQELSNETTVRLRVNINGRSNGMFACVGGWREVNEVAGVLHEDIVRRSSRRHSHPFQRGLGAENRATSYLRACERPSLRPKVFYHSFQYQGASQREQRQALCSVFDADGKQKTRSDAEHTPNTWAAYNHFAGATLKVENERPIAVRDGDRLLVGNIDRLVTIYDGDHPIAADIVEFKTDAVAPDDKTAVPNKVDFYRPQISAYRGAVCSICRLKPSKVSTKLLFVGADIVEAL
jgi:hypothetical protein